MEPAEDMLTRAYFKGFSSHPILVLGTRKVIAPAVLTFVVFTLIVGFLLANIIPFLTIIFAIICYTISITFGVLLNDSRKLKYFATTLLILLFRTNAENVGLIKGVRDFALGTFKSKKTLVKR